MFVVLVIVMGVTTQEAFGITAMRQAFQGFQQAGIERFTGGGIIDGFTVHLSSTRAVVVGLGTAFNFQGMHAHLRQTLNVRNRTQVFGVHDVSAMLVFKGGHVLTRTFGFFNHEHAVSWRADA